jgi:hypothetical protein
MHDWLVGLILEIAVPSRPEFAARTWPAVHLSEFFLSRPDLDTSLNTVGGQRTSAIDVPLVEHSFLDLRVTSDEVVKGLYMGLGAEDGEREVMVLEVETNTRKIDKRLDTSLAELLRVTDTRSLENKRRAESTARDDNLPASFDHP